MGWIPSFKPPVRYDPTWMIQVVESIRTAVNFTSYRTCSGSPVSKVLPGFLGEEVLDVVGSNWYKSVGLGITDWKPLT